MGTGEAHPLLVLRRKRKLTQGELAARAGVSRDAIVNAENGRPIRANTARLTAAALRRRVDTLFPPGQIAAPSPGRGGHAARAETERRLAAYDRTNRRDR